MGWDRDLWGGMWGYGVGCGDVWLRTRLGGEREVMEWDMG